MSRARSTDEVLKDHLQRRAEGDLAGDLEQNYAPDVVLLCEHGAHLGREAVKESADRLMFQLPDAKFEYLSQHIEGEYALLRWRGEAAGARAEHGVDSFVIRDGRIVMQSVYYQLLETNGDS